MKSELELREKLQELLSMDCRRLPPNMMHSKVASCKALLWTLGENDDDRWYITGAPGPPLDYRVKNRN